MKLRIPASLTQQAYQSIRDQIIAGKLDSREHLTETFFASRLQISKSPIREALNRLEGDGLVRIIPRRGVFLCELSIHDVEEIYELKEVMEALVVRNAVLHADVLSRLAQSIDSAAAYLRKKDKVNYIQEDARFHTLLAEASTNSRLRQFLEILHDQAAPLRERSFKMTAKDSLRQHTEILAALNKGQRELAARLMARHVQAVRQRLVEHLAKQEAGISHETDLRGKVRVSGNFL